MIKAEVRVTLRQSILDPQGKATHQALESLGFESIDSVRIGKYVELQIDTDDPQQARRMAEGACQKLLANSVMEDYDVKLEHENAAP